METKNIVMWIIITILVILVAYMVFFQGSSLTVANNVATSTGQAAKSSYSGMVGGC